MGKITGFMEYQRLQEASEAPQKRVKNWREFVLHLTDEQARQQAARCMDCGIPFCHNGCPVNNIIPDWNDLVYRQQWKEALDVLHSTNNFPEITGRICPAPCEAACTLNIDRAPVGGKARLKAQRDRAVAGDLARRARQHLRSGTTRGEKTAFARTADLEAHARRGLGEPANQDVFERNLAVGRIEQRPGKPRGPRRNDNAQLGRGRKGISLHMVDRQREATHVVASA